MAAALAGTMSASASVVVNFDDLATSQPWNYYGNNQAWDTVPTSYQGLTWSGWEVADGRDYTGAAFQNSTVTIPSMNNFAYNGSGVNTITTSGSKFNFEGIDVAFWAYQNARLNQGGSVGSATVTIKGYDGMSLVGTYTATLTKDFTWLATPGLVGLTSVQFLNDGVASSFWVGDNFQYSMVPEPTTMIAGALLLLPFGASTLRILRKRTA
jgi:hypothetical protein